MADVTEVGVAFQCALCGCFAIFAVDTLDPAEVEMKAQGVAFTAGHVQKTLQKDVHAVQEELLEQMQRRFASRALPQEEDAPVPQPHSQVRFAMLPCAVCIEISTGQKYVEWLDDAENLDKPAICTPQMAVIFEAGELPPAYILRGGKWLLASGVGPKDLEVRKPNQLPPGQFRTLLPPVAPPIRSLCWQKEGADDVEPPTVWSDRQALIEAVAELASLPLDEDDASKAAQAPSGAAASAKKAAGKAGPAAKRAAKAAASVVSERAPVAGGFYPWLEELCDCAVETWAIQAQAKIKSERKGQRKVLVGARYVSVPLLRTADELWPQADSKLQYFLSAR